MLPLRFRLQQLTARVAPIALLTLTFGTAAAIYFSDGLGGDFRGYAELTARELSSAEAGRVAEVKVDVGTMVRKGDVIAVLDPSVIDGELETARAEKAVMEATVRAERQKAKIKLEDELSALRRELLREDEAVLRASSQAKVVEAERARLEKLVAEKQAVVDDLSTLSLKEAALLPIVSAKPATMALLRDRIKALGSRSDDDVTAELEAKVALADKRISSLELRRASLVLRAPSDGKVIEVLKRPGDYVAVGTPLLRMVAPHQRIVACVQEGSSFADLPPGTTARVRPRGQPITPFEGRVTSRSPAIEELPAQCQVNPHLPLRGRRVMIEIDEPDRLTAGESVDVEFGVPNGKPAEPAAAVVTSAGAGDGESSLKHIQVPAALAEVTRFEPSGIMREPGRSDYLVVSDDTGLENDRTPMIFRMSPSGVVDHAAAAIDGIEELTDLESIADIDGSVFVLSSQSKSKRGKRPKARTAFLKLAPAGDGFRVAGEQHLIDLLAAESSDFAATLGLSQLDDLEIEGMTAKGGALYFGLKSPLDERGRALIWKLERPADVFAGKSLKTSGLTLFARLPLELGGAEGKARGGVAELLFSGSSLLVASTPSSGDTPLGALFSVADAERGGELAPKLLEQFPGKKPEGICLSLSDPKKVTVVFDNGAAPGEMTELVWP